MQDANQSQGSGGNSMDTERHTGWLVLGLILAVIGMGISIYSTMHHLEVKANGHTNAVCNINDTFNCDHVALSKYSEVGGIPLGVIGLGYFAGIAVLLAGALMGGKNAKDHAHAYLAMVAIGVVVSVVLGGISVGVLGTFCLTCIGIYSVCLAQAGLVFATRRSIPGNFEFKAMTSSGVNAAIALAAVVAIFNFVQPKMPQHSEESTGKTELPTLATKVEDIPFSKSAYAGLGEDYRHGADDAKVVIQEFADFQCPACQKISATLDQIHKEYGERVLIVFRNYPLDPSCNSAVKAKIHQYACQAAVMARCAGQYGKFWEYYEQLFGNQQQINDVNLKDWGRAMGLTTEQIEACWTSPDLLAKIKEDVDLGTRLGVDSTPTLFINGRKVLGGRGIAELKSQIDQLLN